VVRASEETAGTETISHGDVEIQRSTKLEISVLGELCAEIAYGLHPSVMLKGTFDV
jgi:hypothetical protein